MDKYFNNIKVLIENNLIEIKKQEISTNYHTLATYHNIGRVLLEAQGGEARAKYGDNLIKKYSLALAETYGKKYSYRNLWFMRRFYQSFPKVNTLCSQLSWSIFREVLAFKNESKRNYYINSAIEHNFSVRQLIECIKSNAYERLVNKDNIKLKYLDNKLDNNVNILEMIKDPILITINKTADKITEKAMKKFMIENIEHTILELGYGFHFSGSEIPIRINGKIHRPDLVFFNTELNSYVIFEVKLGDLKKIDISQIEFYVRYYDDEIRKPYHNLTVGITISKQIDQAMVKYLEKANIKHTTYELIAKD